MVLTEGGTLYVVLAETDEVSGSSSTPTSPTVSSSRGRRTRASDPDHRSDAGERLLVVNSQFYGPGKPPWTVSSIPLP